MKGLNLSLIIALPLMVMAGGGVMLVKPPLTYILITICIICLVVFIINYIVPNVFDQYNIKTKYTSVLYTKEIDDVSKCNDSSKINNFTNLSDA